jgi:hypothetical protein
MRYRLRTQLMLTAEFAVCFGLIRGLIAGPESLRGFYLLGLAVVLFVLAAAIFVSFKPVVRRDS